MSTQIRFQFDREKAIEAILYIANRIPDPTFHSISKVFYSADKISLERYGRFICGDEYYAFDFGPAPSHVYDLMKRPPESGEYGFVNEKGPSIKPSRDADLDWLSEADRECLDEALRADERLRKRNPKDLFGARTKASHDRAWEKAFKEKGTAGSIRMNVEDIIKEELNNPEELLDYIYNRH